MPNGSSREPVVARLKMNDGFQIAAVPDSDQIGKFRPGADLRDTTYRQKYQFRYVMLSMSLI
jgi:hypothetical protein